MAGRLSISVESLSDLLQVSFLGALDEGGLDRVRVAIGGYSRHDATGYSSRDV